MSALRACRNGRREAGAGKGQGRIPMATPLASIPVTAIKKDVMYQDRFGLVGYKRVCSFHNLRDFPNHQPICSNCSSGARRLLTSSTICQWKHMAARAPPSHKTTQKVTTRIITPAWRTTLAEAPPAGSSPDTERPPRDLRRSHTGSGAPSWRSGGQWCAERNPATDRRSHSG